MDGPRRPLIILVQDDQPVLGRPEGQKRVVEISGEQGMVPLLIGYAAEGREHLKLRQFPGRAGEVLVL